MPDLGIFVERLPRVIIERALRDGADPEIAKKIIATYDDRGDVDGLLERLIADGCDPVTVGLARNATFMIAKDPQCLIEHREFIKHIHAKFYEMVDDGETPYEYSIPYPKIVAALKQADYEGYLSSEYEGNRHIEDAEPVDSVAQVRLHQRMLAALIDEEDETNV
ncbi:hypothetical protein [Nanchangia anserum]|uniref:hypothetical protein n=1 Tax=Nanchangia anserum TaxID=2692125 RepID=UPI001D127DCD|nr:hypothetical protein [Nanchangia anserum]